MILITGASGTVGKAVLAEVAGSGEKHRALYRSKEEAARAPEGTEAVVADFSEKASLARALQGVESVYLVCSPIPELVQLEGNVIEASEAAGVRRIGIRLWGREIARNRFRVGTAAWRTS
jgi:uncharacterized protein YbjT (DUF2867 family)